MKNSAFIILLTLLILSCSKKNDFPQNPEWLNDRIAQMDTSRPHVGTMIYLYDWHGEYFYHISVPYLSCMMCEFYNYQGEKVIWTDEKITDFQKYGKKLGVIWEKW